MNFHRLHQLRVLELRSGIYDSDPDRLKVVKDITEVLSTIPKTNSMARIYIRVQLFGKPPFQKLFKAGKSQKWKALAEEVARIASGKTLRFELDMDIQNQEGDPLGHDQEPIPLARLRELYGHIGKEMRTMNTIEGIDFNFENDLQLEEGYSNMDRGSDSDIY